MEQGTNTILTRRCLENLSFTGFRELWVEYIKVTKINGMDLWMTHD
jgi:hypothetical protein